MAADPSPVDDDTFLRFRGLELTALCSREPAASSTSVTLGELPPHRRALPDALWSHCRARGQQPTRDTTSLHSSSEPLPSDHAPEALPTPAVTLPNAPASVHPGNSQRMTFLTPFKSSTYTNNLGLLASPLSPRPRPGALPGLTPIAAPDSPTALSAMAAWPVHPKGPHPPGGPGAHPCL